MSFTKEIPDEVVVQPAWSRFYYSGRAGYAMQVDAVRYIPLPNEAQVRAHLEQLGVPKYATTENMCKIREEHHVMWIGPVAGLKSGLHSTPDDQGHFLVTTPPAIIEASAGDWPLIKRIMTGLFDDPDHPIQIEVVFAWLRQARANVKAGNRRPLPAIAFIGPKNSGKSLSLEIFRLSLGGRSAPAYRALTNENGFNSDVLGSELLTVDDEIASRDHRARSRFGQAIKSFMWGQEVRVEAKNRDAFSARPVHALAIALNDEAQHIQVLPELDDSIDDKIALIRTGRANITKDEADDRQAFMSRIKSELPAFLHWLESQETPDELRDSRSKCSSWKHPVIVETLSQISPEVRLWELISQCHRIQEAIRDDGFWRGTSSELEKNLKAGDETKHSTNTLLSWTGALGTYLSRLADGGKHGITRGGQRDGLQTWIIGKKE